MDHLPKTPFPDWANDEDYPAGSEDWSASPTKIEITGTVRAAGVQPNDQLTAQGYNWLNHQYGAMLRALVHAAMNTWQGFTVSDEPEPYFHGERKRSLGASPAPGGSSSNDTIWSFISGKPEQKAAEGEPVVYTVPLPTYAKVARVDVRFIAHSGHGALPSQPQMIVRTVKDDGTQVLVGNQFATAGSVPAYEAVGGIALEVDCSDLYVDGRNTAMQLHFAGESGGNFVAGLKVCTPTVSYTDARTAGQCLVSMHAATSPIVGANVLPCLGAFGEFVDANTPHTFVSSGGQSWRNGSPTTGGAPFTDAVEAAPNVVLAINSTDHNLYRSTDMMASWAAIPVLSGLAAFRILHRSGLTGRLIACLTSYSGSTTTQVYVSDDAGLTWTGKLLPNSKFAIYSMADDGNGTIVAVCNSLFADKILRSTDEGDTWTLIQDIPNGGNGGLVAWSTVWEQFLLVASLDASSVLLNSADGATWISRDFGPTTADGLFNPGGSFFRGFACLGGTFALLCNAVQGSRTQNGVLYSFDFGETWNFSTFGYHEASNQLTTIIPHGNRFAVGAPGECFLSGVLAGPDPDLTIA